MAEQCPHLTYREAGDGATFDGADFAEARAFCTVTESFVQPMRADICNARYGLDPETDCEFYVEPEPDSGADSEEASDAGGDDERPDADR